MLKLRQILLLALLILAIPMTAKAAAPHYIIFRGSLLAKPVVMAEWHENQTIFHSLSEEGTVKEELTGEYLDVSLYWGPEWSDYKTQGGSIEELSQKEANQKAQLYLARGGSLPILVLEGRPPRYVGREGIAVLARHGIPTSTSHSPLWLIYLGLFILLSGALLIYLVKSRKKSVFNR